MNRNDAIQQCKTNEQTTVDRLMEDGVYVLYFFRASITDEHFQDDRFNQTIESRYDFITIPEGVSLAVLTGEITTDGNEIQFTIDLEKTHESFSSSLEWLLSQEDGTILNLYMIQHISDPMNDISDISFHGVPKMDYNYTKNIAMDFPFLFEKETDMTIKVYKGGKQC